MYFVLEDLSILSHFSFHFLISSRVLRYLLIFCSVVIQCHLFQKMNRKYRKRKKCRKVYFLKYITENFVSKQIYFLYPLHPIEWRDVIFSSSIPLERHNCHCTHMSHMYFGKYKMYEIQLNFQFEFTFSPVSVMPSMLFLSTRIDCFRFNNSLIDTDQTGRWCFSILSQIAQRDNTSGCVITSTPSSPLRLLVYAEA